jgi:hypothetical protein
VAERPPVSNADDAQGGHRDHDPLLIASLLDRDSAGRARAIAETRVATCPECAALLADLVALSTATTQLPAAVRTRDFRLTTADAARLAASREEPHEALTRLSGKMTNLPVDHATHDELLIASLLGRSQDDPDRDRAEILVATCADCAALHRDLVALSAATRTLPTPPRPRDFTLSPGDAARLRPRGWRRLIGAFGSSRDVLSRPLAMGLTTLGLVGLLVAVVPGLLSGQAGAGGISSMQSLAGAPVNPETFDASREAAPSAAPAPSAAAPAPEGQFGPSAPPAPAALAPAASAAPSEPSSDGLASGPAVSNGGAAIAPAPSSSVPGPVNETTGNTSVPAGSAVENSALIELAALLLLLGLVTFALRWMVRRLGND